MNICIHSKGYGAELFSHFPFNYLKKHLEGLGHSVVHTLDADVCIFIDHSFGDDKVPRDRRDILILMECEMIDPWSYKKRHDFFDRILTYSTRLLTDDRYVKYYYPIIIDRNTIYPVKTKNICMIARNKFCVHPHELYSKRIKVASALKADIYGHGWDKPNLSMASLMHLCSRPIRVLRNPRKALFALGRILNIPRLHTQGPVANKIGILSNYKFAICFENSISPGYVSEKIWDCLNARTVPIYLGSDDVRGVVPEDCYVDASKFKSLSELKYYLDNMGYLDYYGYLVRINRLMKTEIPHSVENFCKIVEGELL
jgi:alpha(1,3/1,4) fucosyltransferase